MLHLTFWPAATRDSAPAQRPAIEPELGRNKKPAMAKAAMMQTI